MSLGLGAGMHASRARCVTADLTYYPADVYENAADHVVYLDKKDGTRIRTMDNATVEMASADARMTFNLSRAWWVHGTVNGDEQTWLVLSVGGCGCGGTSATPTIGQHTAWLALAPTYTGT